MLQRTGLLILSLIVSLSVFSQKSKITGKVISSKTGEVLIGATVSIDGKNKKVQTDQNGQYSISGLEAGTYNVTSTYVSYTAKTISNIKLSESEVVVQDFVMDKAGDMNAVVVKSSGGLNRPKETVSSLLVAQKNSASVSDGISAETIKRTPDKNTGDILKRVSGATLQEDKFAVVRGLNERYNAAYINGAPLPSSESDRKAFAFDIFPANMLDNLVIYKTATPDMPGEFAGGQIVVNTKGIPTENFQSFSYGMGVNTKATFHTKIYYDGGQWDFLGIDNTRKLASATPDILTYKALSLQEKIAYSKKYQPNNWSLLNKNTLPNTNIQYIIGRNIQRNEKDFLGIIFSVMYNKTMTSNDGARTTYAGPDIQSDYTEKSYNTQTLLGAIANLSFKINNNHNISFKNIYTINSEDKVFMRDGRNDILNEPDRYFKSYALWFTSNNIYSSQLIGEHYLPDSKVKISWVGSYSDIRREIPALRRMAFDSVGGSTAWNAKLFDTNPVDNDNTAGLSFYSTTKEILKSFRFDISRSFKLSEKIQSLFKIGGYYQMRDREFNPRLFAFCNYNSYTFDQSLLNLSPDVIFKKDNMGGFLNGKTGFVLKDITEIRDVYNAGSEMYSYYGMADQRFGKKLRLIYGARVESFHQTLNAEYNQFTPVRINTRKTDLLPSVNAVFSLNAKQNLRLCYSKTINRPEFRELAPFLFRDYVIKYSVFGDTSLKRATIDNIDLRYELYPGKAQLLSVSGFYKKFVDPIELIASATQDATLTYSNSPSATMYGTELEIRSQIGTLISSSEHSILNDLTFFGNFTIIKSRINVLSTDTTNYYFNNGRVMQGQSPYVVNAGITYSSDKNNISSTLSVNRYGQRIFLASNGETSQSGSLLVTNLWENGRTQLDFQITKAYPQYRTEFKLNIRDILAQRQFFYEDTNSNNKYDKGTDVVKNYTNFGRTITATFSYKF